MITPELIAYVRSELTKGRTREEIHAKLISDGGWQEEDINEAFRTAIPMQTSAPAKNKPKMSKHNLVFAVVGLLCVISFYFYSSPQANFWNSYVNRMAQSNLDSISSSINDLEESYVNYWNSFEDLSIDFWDSVINGFSWLSMPSFDFSGIFSSDKTTSDTPVVQNNTIKTEVAKDCGTTTSPNLKDAKTYQDNNVLDCLGTSALSCESAKAILKDALFPTMFQIIKEQDVCKFKLSYGNDSLLKDITGNQLAGQSISCPISIVKVLDESKNTSSFTTPSISNPSKYASQIYFYGTLGVFIENNIDKNKIEALGCSGPYIDSVIASYRKAQSQN